MNTTFQLRLTPETGHNHQSTEPTQTYLQPNAYIETKFLRKGQAMLNLLIGCIISNLMS